MEKKSGKQAAPKKSGKLSERLRAAGVNVTPLSQVGKALDRQFDEAQKRNTTKGGSGGER